jgi:tetratricopeptide (TPR) repeat protein
VELAQWYAEEWKYSMKRGEPLIQIRRKAANAAEAAIDLDPEGLEGYRVKYQLNLTFAKGSVTETNKLYELASEAMATLVRRDPTEAGNHFRWAEVLFQLGDQEAGKKQAEEALRLDRLSADPARKLRDSQRWQMLAELDPDNVSVRYQLTEALYLERDREHREQGRREAEKTLQLHQQANNPNNALTDSQRRNLELWLRPPSSN